MSFIEIVGFVGGGICAMVGYWVGYLHGAAK